MNFWAEPSLDRIELTCCKLVGNHLMRFRQVDSPKSLMIEERVIDVFTGKVRRYKQKKALDPDEKEYGLWAEPSLDKDRWKIIEFWSLWWG